ncbi:hypothetical protein NBRC116583_13710 [Arenicella sp. 4NH20-0111]|uniref:LysM peptidoglycan-binding domain-containing protein n=1 Tax=Arenicella sp. 4NH20-0111 TaxID=3127648 RepID=UPI003106C53B
MKLITLLFSLSALCWVPVVTAKVPNAVGDYKLDCNETFSCPASLMPRVAFWIEVFSRWDTNTAIFHDKNNPHRVFSTVKRKEGCRRSRKGDSIDRERKRLKKTLSSLATKLKGKRNLTRTEESLRSLFQDAPISSISQASENIRCQSGNRNRMRTALSQFMTYQPVILDALHGQSLTPELQYLPFVESAFDPKALSHVGAAGLWQIMPSTGRTLGLTVNSRVDERYDPRAATYAAAKYFRNSVDNLSETAFENGFTVVNKDLNPFVITSYNYGVRGMERAIKQVGLDYEKLLKEYRSPSFQTAVKNFYASFLAARHVAKNSNRFFGEIKPDNSVSLHSYNTIALKRATSIKRLSKQTNVSIERLKIFNPALNKVVWKHKALVPKGFKLKLPFTEEGWTTKMASVYSLPAEKEEPGFVWHKVRRGQTACGIAEKYRASCRALRRLNGLNRKATIYVGKRIKVPTRTAGISVAKSKATDRAPAIIPNLQSTSSAPPKTVSMTRYRVKPGDSACSIARNFDMKCNELLAINGLTRQSVIRVGQRLSVSASNSWHTVRRGQSACQIAESYRVKCSLLLDANRLRRSDTIQVGQRLRVPTQRY